MTNDIKAAEEVADWFNEAHPVGTDVTYFPGAMGGCLTGLARQGKTRTPAWVLPSGEPVVSVTGYAGGISLRHIVCANHATHAIAVSA